MYRPHFSILVFPVETAEHSRVRHLSIPPAPQPQTWKKSRPAVEVNFQNPGKFGEILHIPNGEIQNFPITKNPHFPIWRNTPLGKFLFSPLGKVSMWEFPYFPIIAVKFPNGNVEFPHWGNWISLLGKINEFPHVGN